MMAVNKANESHNTTFGFAKILISKSTENSKDVAHKISTKCRKKEKKQKRYLCL